MARLDIEREKELNPKRMDYARKSIAYLGYPVTQIDDKTLEFTFRKSIIRVYPYSGWYSGKTVEDGRGIENLLKQIPMRWALRNQNKIKEALGEDILKKIKTSLADAFAVTIDIESDIQTISGEPYPILIIDDSHTFNLIAFYVVRKQFDVYTLAFKEFIG